MFLLSDLTLELRLWWRRKQNKKIDRRWHKGLTGTL